MRGYIKAIAIALGVFAALINLPIKEAAIARQAQPLRTADA